MGYQPPILAIFVIIGRTIAANEFFLALLCYIVMITIPDKRKSQITKEILKQYKKSHPGVFSLSYFDPNELNDFVVQRGSDVMVDKKGIESFLQAFR